VLTNLKRSWKQFRRGRPGRRFQDEYERTQRTRKNKPLVLRMLQPVIGCLLLATGIVFLVIPGPGLPLVFVGAGLLAGRFLLIARAMDWCEVRLRKLFSWAKSAFCHGLRPVKGRPRQTRRAA
jgi:uncharacterized protein (TIGR02611 family)